MDGRVRARLGVSRGAAAALLAAPVALLVLFFAYPLAFTLREAVGSADAWTWATTHPYPRARLATAFLQAALSAALTLILAGAVAGLHHARRIPFTRLHLALHAAPFVLPVFVVVFGLQALLGRGGLLDEAVGLDALGAMGPLGAVVLAHAYYNYGFAARLLHATLERRPHRLEEAARTLGAPPRRAFLRVTLPLLLPSLGAIALLAFLFAFASFGVVLYLGEGQVGTLDTLLYENTSGGFPAYDRAAVVGIAQVAINLALLAGYTALRRAQSVPREPPRAAPAAGRGRIVAAWVAAALALAPAAAVLVGAFRVRGEWTLEAVRALLDPTHASHVGGFDPARALALTLLYAAATVVLSLALTVALAYGLAGARGPARRAAEVAASLPLGVSSLLLGFGFLLAFGAGAFLDLRGSLAAIVLAHTLVAFPFVARVMLPAFEERDVRLDEAASVLGAPPRDVARRIHLPLLAPALLASAGLAVAVSLGDFGASLVLMRPDNMSLAVWIAQHGGPGSFDPLRRAQARALAALLMALAAAAFALVEAAGARWEGRP